MFSEENKENIFTKNTTNKKSTKVKRDRNYSYTEP